MIQIHLAMTVHQMATAHVIEMRGKSMLLLSVCLIPEAYSEPCQASKMEIFAKIVNGWKLLTILTKIASSQMFYRLLYTSMDAVLFACWNIRHRHIHKQPPKVFCKRRCPWKSLRFYRRTPFLESLSNKFAGLQACNFIKKRLQCKCFPVKFVKFWRISILKNICERLLLLIAVLKT